MTPYLGMFSPIYTVEIQFILIINTNSIINQYHNFRGWRIRTHSQHAITLEWKLHWKQVVEQTEKYCLNTCM